jgi:endonuclease/exonuclease/phosphatase family metal-dependent hydrolase
MALGTISCDKKSGNPDWDTPGGTPSAVQESSAPTPKPAAQTVEDPSTSSPKTQKPEHKTTPSQSKEAALPAKPEAGKNGLQFIGYNVENWLTMDRFVDNRPIKSAPKPDSEKKQVIRILAANAPDVIGICEIGEASDLAEIQESLKAAGLDLPHSYYTGGTDPVRHLGMLSRYPITATGKITELEYQMNGQTFGFNRGILDATITANGKPYHFLGVHLKSKRDVEEGDQEQMRIHEAHMLRKHVDSILQADPQARLIVYGDFNDTYPSKAVKVVTGSTEETQRLMPIYFKDSKGEAWTHHWKNQDIYSRIDFVTVSHALRSEVDFRQCRIVEDPAWNEASDHRPLMTVFK